MKQTNHIMKSNTLLWYIVTNTLQGISFVGGNNPENQSLSCYFLCLSWNTCTDTHVNWLASIDHRHHHPLSSLTLPPCCPWKIILLPCQFCLFGSFTTLNNVAFPQQFLDLTTGLVILRITSPLLPDNFIISQSIFISQWINLMHVTADRNQK